ncbi:hypothetical protein LCY76_15465 [Fictibacillus sp. KIGAM418]|uniref:Uncharacterized protein n=1 Tax=Fictibacillus marinisediminis TaxID=2878389 RepID=A0A9X1XC30_9BACL|nr:hypothetical protein [Fictibacillus marinisediminis]MCK6257976.1 hypothetical protein [Fictibacillus marinisediminis]
MLLVNALTFILFTASGEETLKRNGEKPMVSEKDIGNLERGKLYGRQS